MTDQPHGNGRIDLRAIDGADAGQANRVIAGAMARIATAPAQEPRDVVGEFAERFSRPALAAAAVLAALAAGTVVASNRTAPDAPDTPVATLASWAGSAHVPTNAELLLTFEGYGR